MEARSLCLNQLGLVGKGLSYANGIRPGRRQVLETPKENRGRRGYPVAVERFWQMGLRSSVAQEKQK